MNTRPIIRAATSRLTTSIGAALLTLPFGLAVAPMASAGGPGAIFIHHQGTGIARSYCPAAMPLTGGGAFVETDRRAGEFMEEALRQSHPISDRTGTNAYDEVATGWQGASSDFLDDITVFSICATPALAAVIGTPSYVSAEGPGIAFAYCPEGARLVGGGGYVESPSGGAVEVKLRQSSPVSDYTGTDAYEHTGIGWRAASMNFEGIVKAFAICVTPAAGSTLELTYRSAQNDAGPARAYCEAGESLVGGGGYAEIVPGSSADEKLRQSYPIADDTGTIASGANGVGWQAATSDFQHTAKAFAICATFSRAR